MKFDADLFITPTQSKRSMIMMVPRVMSILIFYNEGTRKGNIDITA